MKKIVLFVAILFLSIESDALVKLPGIFTDHMVLQRNVPLQIWGTASPNERISLIFHRQQKTVNADEQGNWKVMLTAEKAGGPYQLIVKATNTITLNDILVGEVWVCSGQSNMEWPLELAKNAKEEISNANYPQIRHIKITRNTNLETQDDILPGNSWQVCNSENAGSFTAVGYFFARKMYKELNIPIGLINSTWGGTNAETWISKTGFSGMKDFDAVIKSYPQSFDELKHQFTNKILQTVHKFQETDNENADPSLWKTTGFDDGKWTNISPLKTWEEQRLQNFDGEVWYRKTVQLSAADAAYPFVLHAGKIDDSDSTFINGIFIGATPNSWNTERVYKIPAGVLLPGKNIIAIKVTDTGGGGGLYGTPDLFDLVYNNYAIHLSDGWKARVDENSIAFNSDPNSLPSLLFNAMINPLLQYKIKGVIWYQGESNADRAFEYQKVFPALINDWRRKFKQGNFPFYFVQLSSFNANNENGSNGSKWAELREAQTKTLSLPNTGMAVTTDIGDSTNIHPANKQDVGYRLALQALNKTYSKNIFAGGPVFKSMQIQNGKSIISFDRVAKGLKTKKGEKVVYGFMIAGADQKFLPANAFIQNNRVVVFNDQIKKPVAVRFAWTDITDGANLFNSENLPAAPFRTDKWNGITEGKKYVYR
jgi:sialate O-acetylesterase